jgi:hypothetical protein
MIQLTQQGLNFTGVERDVDALRREFDRRHCLHSFRVMCRELLLPDGSGLIRTSVHVGGGCAVTRPKWRKHKTVLVSILPMIQIAAFALQERCSSNPSP